MTGNSNGWQTITGTLPAGATAYRLRYWTDGAAGGEGIAVGDVKFAATDDTMSDTSKFDPRQLAQGDRRQLHRPALLRARPAGLVPQRGRA
jgi:hypothetical protein